MRKIIFVLPFLLVFSCDELEVSPKNGATASFTFTSAEVYKRYLAKVYASMSMTGQDGPHGNGDLSIISDEGFTSYIRAYWKGQELTTDEAVIAWTDAGLRDLHLHTWSSENQFIRVLYYRIYYLISLANDFLEQSTPDKLAEYGIPEADRDLVAGYRDDVRYIRAMAYFHALDFFRNVPLIKNISADYPTQNSPEEVFNFIIDELNEIEATLPAPRAGEYGRADQAAVWMLKAKMFLNAEVFIGQDMYADVITEVNKVIGAGYALNADYSTLFMADNHTSTEIIFALNSDGTNSQNWGNTTFLVHAAVGGDIMDPAEYGIDGGWGGLRTTSAMVEKWDDPSGNTDSRPIFFTDGQTLDIADIGEFSNGYAVPKYVNITSAGGQGSNITHVDTDYPMFRLADAYLMYAEANLRGGGGDAGTALGYINELRQRAYGDNSGDITAGELTLDFILDERVRELYWEGTRRMDLIRFGEFSDNGTWPWKGGDPDGIVTDSFRDIFPIPASDLIANPKLKQNPGYGGND